MSRELETELMDLAKWLHEHRKNSMSLEQRLKFLDKSLDILLWVFARAVEDIQKLEHREKAKLFIPHNVRFDKNIRTPSG